MKDIKVKPEKENAQQKVVLYQILQKKLEELQQEVLIIERKFLEIESASQTLSDIGKGEGQGDVYFSVGSGIYAKGKVTDRDNIMVEIGRDIMVSKDVKGAREVLDSRKADIEKEGEKLKNSIETTVAKLREIASEIQSMQP